MLSYTIIVDLNLTITLLGYSFLSCLETMVPDRPDRQFYKKLNPISLPGISKEMRKVYEIIPIPDVCLVNSVNYFN